MKGWRKYALYGSFALVILACGKVNPDTGDSNPRPTVHCNDTAAGCPMQTGKQPPVSPEGK